MTPSPREAAPLVETVRGRPANDLLGRHDIVLADLDGTLYRGGAAIPGAAAAVQAAARRGVGTTYVTNNASRGPTAVAAHLAELGFPARPADVVTSAQAAAALSAPRGALRGVGAPDRVERLQNVLDLPAILIHGTLHEHRVQQHP